LEAAEGEFYYPWLGFEEPGEWSFAMQRCGEVAQGEGTPI